MNASRIITSICSITLLLGFAASSVTIAQDDPPPPLPREHDEAGNFDHRPGPPRPWRDREHGPMRGPDQDNAPLPTEELQRRLEVLREIDPQLAEHLDKWRQRSPERVSNMLRQQWPRLSHIMETKTSDPELYELRVKDLRLTRESGELADRLRKAREAGNADDAAKVEQELTNRLGEHFDVRQQVRQRELAMLERRLNDMRERLEKRQASRDELVKQRLEILLGESKGPEW